MFGRTLGKSCDKRVEGGECVTNPLFMMSDCRKECGELEFVDENPFLCRRQARLCFNRGLRITPHMEGLDGDSSFEDFVFNKCNRTCTRQYKMVEEIFAPNDIQLLIHHILPWIYTLLLIALLGYQAIVVGSNKFMMWLEDFKKNEKFTATAEKMQEWLILASEHQEDVAGFGPKAVGRFFVCGYYIMEGSAMFGIFAVLVYMGQRARLHRTHPALLKYAHTGLFLYSSMEAFFTLVKGLLLGIILNNSELMKKLEKEHHEPIEVDAELMCKKLAMLGVAMLFLQSSSAWMPEERLRRSALDAGDEEPERPPLQEGFLLFGRLLMVVIFCFVGFFETRRVLSGQVHNPPDGRDVLWPKLIQLVLVIPFTLGFKTTIVTELLALSMFLEAMTEWRFWNEMYHDMPAMFHALGAKDHFATNVAVAGGLFLLQKDPGKYTLDAWMKKKD